MRKEPLCQFEVFDIFTDSLKINPYLEPIGHGDQATAMRMREIKHEGAARHSPHPEFRLFSD